MTRLEKCEYLKSQGYTYDSESGKIYGIYGKEITQKKNGYIVLINKEFKGKLLSHHFAWYMSYGNVDFDELDHINRMKTDNRIKNLRIANRTLQTHNSYGKGYSFSKRDNKWVSEITVNYKKIYLGRFDTEEEARKAYLIAKEKYHTA